jgi:hypothetical protein
MAQPNPQVSSPPRRTIGVPPTSTVRNGDSTPASDEDIAMRAYEKFVARGCVHGFDRQDWAAAERELIVEAFRQ